MAKAVTVYQYEQPRCPEGWNESERRFYARIIETLDDIYSKYGRIDEKLLSSSFVTKVNNAPDVALEKLEDAYSSATVDDLMTKSLTANAARIVELTVEKMIADTVVAGQITAGTLESTFAYMVSLSAKFGSFDFETVQNLVSGAMVLEKGSADSLYIKNLSVLYAQILNATIGSLCIQASDGNYYQIDVTENLDGEAIVNATKVEVNEGEISAGQTESGKVILDTDILAERLTTGTLFATEALTNSLLAAKIDVDTLTARSAFIQKLTSSEAFIDRLVSNTAFIHELTTRKIIGEKSLEMIAGTADAARSAAEAAQSSADTAQSAADAAKSAADTAQSAAEAAQGTADGAMLATAHVGVKPPEAPIPAGRQWLDQGVEPWTLRSWIGADVRTEPEYAQTHSGNPVVLGEGRVLSLDSIRNSFAPVQAGSGEASPDNIRPISGRTGVELTRCGKNLLKNTATSQTINGVTFTVNADGAVTANGTATADSTVLISSPTLPAGEYIGSGCPSGGDAGSGYSMYFGLFNGFETGNGYSFSLSGETQLDRVRIVIRSGVTVSNLVFKPMIRLASITDTAYEPYHGDTYTADFGQTVYGGTLDWLTGVLTVDRGILTMDGTEDIAVSNDSPNKMFVCRTLRNGNITDWTDIGSTAQIVCSHFTNSTAEIVYGVNNVNMPGLIAQKNRDFWFTRSNYASLDEFKAYLAAQYAAGTPVQVCYRLAEPIVVQLNLPAVYPLEGTNVLYGGTGALEVDSTASGWRVVNDPAELQSAQEALALQQARMDEALNRLGMAMVLDADGVHVHRPVTNPPCETLTADDSFNVLVNSAIAATFAASYQKMGGQIVVRQTSNGLIFGG